MSAEVLLPAEAAAELRCSVSAIYTLVNRGTLRAFRVGKRGVRITRAALDAYMTGEAS